MIVKHSLVVVALLAVIGAPLTAHAAPADKANEHIGRAMQAHEKGDFSVALAELEAAYAVAPRPELLYAIAQVHVKLDRCADAVAFYERFLATKPGPQDTADTKQAIQTCKAKQQQAAPPPPDRTPPPPPPSPPPQSAPTTRPWYTDKLGDALVIGGAVSTIVGLVVYSGARSDISDANAAPSYQEHVDLVDDAESKRTLSVVLIGGGVALITAGVLHYMLGDRRIEPRSLAVVPTSEGGLVTWIGRF